MWTDNVKIYEISDVSLHSWIYGDSSTDVALPVLPDHAGQHGSPAETPTTAWDAVEMAIRDPGVESEVNWWPMRVTKWGLMNLWGEPIYW